MNLPLNSGELRPSYLLHEFPVAGTLISVKLKEPDAVRRRRALRRVDRELSKGNYKTALTLIKQMQGKPGGLRGFGAAKQVPRRISSLDDLKLSGMDISYLQSLRDSILKTIEARAEFQLSDEVSLAELVSMTRGGSYESLCQEHLMCMQHEAGHFLVGYLLGLLPKRYVVSNMEALRRDKFAGGSVEFLGFEFLREVDAKILHKNSRIQVHGVANEGKLSSTVLNKFLCVILGGLAAEHLLFGYSHGLHSDLEKLDRVLKWMGFTESEADSRVKWAATNTTLLLVRHQEATSRLAEAMGLGKSVGFCIDVIENTLNNESI